MVVPIDALSLAIFERLAGDPALDDLLARTVIGSADGPAIYTTIPVPSGAVLPYVVVYGPIINEPDDPAPSAPFRDPLTFDVHCYAPRPDDGGGSVATVNAIAERVLVLFHREALSLPLEGVYAKNLDLFVSGPIVHDGPTAFGRLLTLNMRVAVAPATV